MPRTRDTLTGPRRSLRERNEEEEAAREEEETTKLESGTVLELAPIELEYPSIELELAPTELELPSIELELTSIELDTCPALDCGTRSLEEETGATELNGSSEEDSAILLTGGGRTASSQISLAWAAKAIRLKKRAIRIG